MKFEVIKPDGETIAVVKPPKKKVKKQQVSEEPEYIVFEEEGSCGCCCSGNSNVNPNKRCSVCKSCTHVAECEELYFYGRCICGKGKKEQQS